MQLKCVNGIASHASKSPLERRNNAESDLLINSAAGVSRRDGGGKRRRQASKGGNESATHLQLGSFLSQDGVIN